MNATDILQTLTATDMDAGLVFSGKPSGTRVKGYANPCLFTPKLNPNYIFHESSRDVIVWLIAPPTPLYVCGVCGAGKSSLINQLAARLNYPVFEVTGHNRLEFQDLAGHHTVQDGNMKFEYGPLALAMKYGGLFLINELDLLEPATATGLNGVLDGQPLCIPENGGEIITPHPMFRFAATANTNGGSDETGLYQGTLRMNMALMDRFTVVEVNYPSPEAELLLLEKSAPALPGSVRTKMVDYANEVRRLFMGETDNAFNTIEITFSTRTLLRWADLTLRYQPLASQGIQPVSYALDRALGFRATRETRAMLHELAQRIFATTDESMNITADYTESQSDSQAKRIAQALNHLAAEAASMPDTLSFNPQISLTAASSSGGKFWEGSATVRELKLRWGRMGTCGATRILSFDQCAQHNTVLELRDRALSKLAKGYSLVAAETRLS